METTIAALTRYQVKNFFSENNRPTQDQCDRYAAKATGKQPTATPVQGGSSYTVVGAELVVQFRAENAPLDLEFLRHVEKAYAGFVPWHTDSGKLGNLHVYMMRNVGGVSMYLARDSLYANNCYLLRQTLLDFARFFASAWHNTPMAMPVPDRKWLYSEYLSDLKQLSTGLPKRFCPVLNGLIERLPYLLALDWPLVANHIDLLENNIHADTQTGTLAGVVDWAGAQVGSFGISLGGVENILGIAKTDFSHEYHANHHELRELFYKELHLAIWGGPASAENRQRLEDARLIGLFFLNGWRYEGGTRAPAREGDASLCYLHCVLEATCDGY
ncbi:uncharacterized protein B0H18DRAFT_878915 [Fomitopsis serialis]|uniref:uncharacterized protein n=1 Tax=Fomitopsis serialis TaxID=139415 RepID=UPI00200784CF|nr:uncharacterized protein B0H18DRAFT_878915 [Neoantrodia serialis]KAH9922906.1 hypothetical protein B0H18DRAFT_878915 [Neoantrodia serialis]